MRQSTDYPVLRRPRLTAGVGYRVATLLWSGFAVVALLIGFPIGLIAAIPTFMIHAALSWAFKIDHTIFENYAIYATMPNEYRAGLPSDREAAVSRPDRFARGISL